MPDETGANSSQGGSPSSTSPRPPTNQHNTGRGRGTGGGTNSRYRGSRSNNRNHRRGTNQESPSTSFKGSTADMNGHVFQTHPESRNLRQFHRSLEELELYVSRTFKNPGDLRSIFSTSEHEKTIAPPTIADPKGPTIENSDGSTTEKEEDAWTAVERMMLQEECKRVIARRNTLKENLHKLWSVIWGQCSPSMQERLIGTPGYDSAKKSDNAPALIQYIKGVSFDFESQQHPIDAIDTAITKFFGAQQGATESLSMFHQRFRTLANIVTQHAGSDFFCQINHQK